MSKKQFVLTKIFMKISLYRYAKLLQQYAKEKRERKRSESKRRSSTRLSESKA
jgi:hypothetical protein